MEGQSLELYITLPEYVIQALDINEGTLFESFFDEETMRILIRTIDLDDLNATANTAKEECK